MYYFPEAYQCEAAGHKEGLVESVRSQAGDARANRDLQNATNNFFNGICFSSIMKARL